MKKLTIISSIFVLLLATALMADPDDYLLHNHFGVSTLYTEDAGNPYSHFANGMSWASTSGHWTVEDWGSGADAPDPGPTWPISEVFDIEALYLDVDYAQEQVYFSIVTSMPNTGFDQVGWYPGYLFRAGDIRFGVGDDTYVLGTFGGFYGNLYLNPDMTYTDGYRGFADRGDPVLDQSNMGDELATSGTSFSYQEYLYADGSSLMEQGYATYLMEGSISFADFGNADFQTTGLSMTLGMSCNNDIASLDISPVPEPTTIALLGLGLIGLYSGRRRFLKK